MTGAVFQPELIALMRSVLDEAVAALPESKRTSTIKSDMAAAILGHAAQGEHNPAALKMAALQTVTESPRYCHDISQARRAV